MGESKSKIAQDLRIDSKTVTKILDINQTHLAVDYGKLRIHRMTPKLCDNVEKAVNAGDVDVSMDLLHGIGVLKSGNDTTPSVTINVNILNQIRLDTEAAIEEIKSWSKPDPNVT